MPALIFLLGFVLGTIFCYTIYVVYQSFEKKKVIDKVNSINPKFINGKVSKAIQTYACGKYLFFVYANNLLSLEFKHGILVSAIKEPHENAKKLEVSRWKTQTSFSQTGQTTAKENAKPKLLKRPLQK